ncbi:hypothetical protein [Flavobacterium sp.]|uniref:hypothetical protein n=1 Tax=Flavobacterium sp. TaxID=239 RepID=UPI00286E2D33|nr:hypothetical protein [Flavobacterium sp.]
MKKIFLLFVILFYVLGFSQNSKIHPVLKNSYSISADTYIGFDAFGFDYYIKDNVLFKTKDTEMFQYKNISLGKISKIDIQNPLKIILFYENFNTIIALDNQLNEVQKINLSEINPNIAATAVGIASNNTIWLFDSLKQQFVFYNYVKNTFQNIGLPISKTIKNYTSGFNTFYWIDETNAFYSMDIFGKIKLINQIPEYELIFIVDEKTILYSKNNLIYIFDVKKNDSTWLENIPKSVKNFYYKEQILSIFTNEGIINFKINIP